MDKDINFYKQNGNTCAIACMLMILEYYKIIPKANYLYEKKYYKSYHSKYTEGTPFSALAWHFAKNGLCTEIIHSEEEFFTNKNNVFEKETYENLLKEYIEFLNYASKLDAVIKNGVEINNDFLKKQLEDDKLIILAGQVNNILHAILLCGYTNDAFIVCDPLYKQKRNITFKEIDNFMNTSIGKWCVTVKN